MTGNRINVTLFLNTEAFERAVKRVEGRLTKFSKRLTETGSTLTQALTIPLGIAGGAAVQAFLQFDKLEKGLQVFAGSADQAKQNLKDLNSIVLDSRTTIGFQDAVQGSLRLQSIGFSADQAREALRQLAIATTASGKSSEDLGEVTNQLTQIIGRGQILQQDIRVILDRLPVLASVFRETFGGVSAEAIRASTDNVGDFAAKLFTAIQTGKQFQNVQFSAAKAVETFKESAQLAGAEIGRTIFESLRLGEVLELLAATINRAVAAFKNLSPETQRLVTTLGLIAVAIGPVLFAIGALVKLIPVLTAGIVSLGLSVGGIGAAFFGVVFVVQALADEFGSLEDALDFIQAKFIKLGVIIRESVVAYIKSIAKVPREISAVIRRDFAELAKIVQEETLSYASVQTKADAAFEKSLRDSVERRQIAFLELQFKQRELEQRANFGALRDLFGGAPTGEEIEVPKSVKERRPFPNLQPLQGTFSSIGEQLRGISNQFFALPGAVKSITAETETLNAKFTEVQNPAIGLKQRISDILTESRLLGISQQDQYRAIISEIEAAILNVNATFGSQSPVIEVLRANLEAYRTELDAIIQSQERLNEVNNLVASGFDMAASMIERSGATLKNVFAAIGRAALQAAATVVRAKLIESVASVVADAFKKFGLLGTVVAAGAGAAAGAIFQAAINKISAPRLASGGLAYSETLAVVGDNRNARVDPEVIAPLSKLKNLIGGGSGYVAEARISGDDLLLLVSRADERLNLLR